MPVFDTLPQWLQHLILMAVAGVMAVELPNVQQDLPTYHLPGLAASALGVLIPYALMWATSITHSYGKGSNQGAPFTPDLVASADPAPPAPTDAPAAPPVAASAPPDPPEPSSSTGE